MPLLLIIFGLTVLIYILCSKANQSYHQYECGIIKLLLESGLNIYAYLALRLVTKEGLENLLKIKDDLELRRSEKSGASEDIKGFTR